MDFESTGPLHLLVIGFGPEVTDERLVLEELERRSARGLLRGIDSGLLTKDDRGSLTFHPLGSGEEEAAAGIIDALLEIGPAAPAEPEATDEVREEWFGFGPDDLVALKDGLSRGGSVGLVLVEHGWALEWTTALRTAGALPIAQGFLTREALATVAPEVQKIVTADAAIELDDAIRCAARLDSLARVVAPDDVRTVAAVEAVQALMAAGLLPDEAAEEALDALLSAGLVQTEDVATAASRTASNTRAAGRALDAVLSRMPNG